MTMFVNNYIFSGIVDLMVPLEWDVERSWENSSESLPFILYSSPFSKICSPNYILWLIIEILVWRGTLSVITGSRYLVLLEKDFKWWEWLWDSEVAGNVTILGFMMKSFKSNNLGRINSKIIHCLPGSWVHILLVYKQMEAQPWGFPQMLK